jgi:PAS domain S-box-containing protein
MHAVLTKKEQLIEFQRSCDLNGTEKWFSARIMSYYGTIPRVVVAFNDISAIKQAEQKLRNSEEHYKTLLDTTDEMINTVAPDGKISWANNAWKENLQYTDEEIERLYIKDVLLAEAHNGFEDRLQRLRSGETLRDMKVTMIGKDGRSIDAEGTIVPLFEKGMYAGSQGFFRNVTEFNRERAERVKVETRMQRTLDNMLIGCSVIDFEYTFLYMNDAAAAQTYLDPESVIGRSIHEVLPGVENTAAFTMFRQCMEKRKRVQFDERYTFPNGIKKWLEFKIEPIEEGIFIMSVDITERKTADDNIRKHRNLLTQAQRIAHLGSWELDLLTNELYWSDEVFRIFEINPEKFGASYDSFLELVHPEDKEMVHEAYSSSVASGTPYDIVHRLLFPDGRVKYLHEQGETTYNKKGVAIRSVGTVHDITERTEAEQILHIHNQELKKINSELDRFVYSTSHDLRAPLLSLLGLIDLSMNAEDETEMQQYFQMMKNSISRMDGTIREILTYSRNSRMQLSFELLDIRTIVNNLIENIMHIDGVRNIHFAMDIDDSTPFYSDKLRVVPVIDNLLTNAIKYTRSEEANPFVKFTFRSDRDCGVFIVEDNGEGIAEDKLEKIFEMFYRNSEKSVGSGLGLYICREIVSKMGGNLTVKSELGKGSVFTIELPNNKLFN